MSTNGREKSPAAWVQKAEHDLLSIRNNMAAVDVPWDVVTFHAQQAAEKYLKAFLVLHEIEPPKVHDLERLLQVCTSIDPVFGSLATPSRRLTQLGFVSRYPDTPSEPSEEDAREAVKLAETICAAVRARIRTDEAERASGTPPLTDA